MARKGHGQPEVSSLPKVVFTRVADDPRESITGIDNKQALSYGCKDRFLLSYFLSLISDLVNDGEPFQRPEHYIRYIGKLSLLMLP